MSTLAYLDSSALLRFIFNEPEKLNIESFSKLYSSDLIRVECLRACYRARLDSRIDDAELTEFIVRANRFFDSLYLIPVSRLIITRSAQAFPVNIRSLDSIHLATAILLQERSGLKCPILTHDLRLAQAAKALGMEVTEK